MCVRFVADWLLEQFVESGVLWLLCGCGWLRVSSGLGRSHAPRQLQQLVLMDNKNESALSALNILDLVGRICTVYKQVK